MGKQNDMKTVFVTGDVTIDWNIARIRQTEGIAQTWTSDEVTAAFCQHGGAAMLADLVTAIAGNLRQRRQVSIDVRQVSLPGKEIMPTDAQFPHSYAMWAPFAMDERSEKKVWRVQEFLGLNPAHTDVISTDTWKDVKNERSTPDIIIISDANLGFRQRPELWPAVITGNTARPWVLVNTARPVAKGELWEALYRNHRDHLIAVMTVNDLRGEQVQISRHLSWERTAQDLVWGFLYNPSLSKLAQCAHVIVSFGTTGVLLFSQSLSRTPNAILFFEPTALEGEWGRQYKGSAIGYNSCLIGGIARELILNASQPDIPHGIQSGIRAMRFLHIQGYGQVSNNLKEIELAFPTEAIALVLAEDGDCVSTTVVMNPSREPPPAETTNKPVMKDRYWAILEDRYPELLENIAVRIVQEGLESALLGVPVQKFGRLKTVDRREIEALNSISSLIREYSQRYQQTPFSIAVFGPPGSGKSFAVKEVANSVIPGEIVPITFNLSQFAGIENLFDAFHQVRDIALSGRIPLVFWDEFDTFLQNQPLGWLRYFLAPMQDGEFQEGQITHPIGRSIFVFAGGTSHSMETFGASLDEKEKRAVKLPDFVSRLKGFLNILGPNPQDMINVTGQVGDPYYIIRRAILLRSILERLAPRLLHNEGKKKILAIDQGVLRAFLLTREYKHGARSIEAIVAMSQLAGKTTYERSCLPSEAQVSLHVDGRDFSAVMQRMELNSYIVEKLAQVVHEIFCSDLKAKGYKYGPVTDEEKREHNSLLPFAELPEDEKEQNRQNARDIQNKLKSAGFDIIPALSNEAPGSFTDEEVGRLAQMEHERWMKQKLANGWFYASETDKAKKLHKDLVAFDQLPEEEKEKDRILVRGIPEILTHAGYKMVKTAKK
jgi:hypothetical protein